MARESEARLGHRSATVNGSRTSGKMTPTMRRTPKKSGEVVVLGELKWDGAVGFAIDELLDLGA